MEARREGEDLLAGRYRLERTLGHGGMAVVFAAVDTLLDRVVAIKVFQRRRGHGRELRERFLREARAEAKISSPEVVTLHDVGETADGRPFIVMELLDGQPLSTLLAEGPLDGARAARVAAGVARGLAAAHGHGIVHRDVKPANVMVGEADAAVLTDFGLARAFDAENAELTSPGSLLGSAHYVAPEQVRSGAATPRSDLYALGALLYHALSGAPPFEGIGPMDIAMRRLESRPVALRRRAPHVDGELAALVDRLLARDPRRRPGDAAAVAGALEAIAARLEAAAAGPDAPTIAGVPLPPPRATRRPRPWRWTLPPLPFPEPTRAEAAIAAAIAVFFLVLVAAAGAPRPARSATVPATAPHRASAAVRRAPVPRVPDVRGEPARIAVQRLYTAGYEVRLYAVASSDAPGTVLGELPKPGVTTARGATVHLLIADSPPHVVRRNPSGSDEGD